MPVDEVVQCAHERADVQVAVHPDPGSFVVDRVEGVELVIEQQQLLAVARQGARAPLLLAVEPTRSRESGTCRCMQRLSAVATRSRAQKMR